MAVAAVRKGNNNMININALHLEPARLTAAARPLRKALDAPDSCRHDLHLASKGWAYLVGRDVPQDYDQALKHFEQGRRQGDMAACGLLGWMHLLGLSTSRDIEKGMQYLKEARKGGDAAAPAVLAAMYIDGNGVAKNVEKALCLLHDGRERGHRAASRMLGQIYLDGDDVGQDLQKAYRYLFEASEKGDTTAQGLLNEMVGTREPSSEGPQQHALEVSSAVVLADRASVLSHGCKYHAQPCPKICRLYQRDGTCHYGSTCIFCHFDHDESITRGPRRGRTVNNK
jgi:hypothetical protein